jgi:hypothetical protein
VKKVKQIQSARNQVAAFRKAARELGCDESEGRFQEAFEGDREAETETTSGRRPRKASA